jgi:hypothetical protein
MFSAFGFILCFTVAARTESKFLIKRNKNPTGVADSPNDDHLCVGFGASNETSFEVVKMEEERGKSIFIRVDKHFAI